MKRGRKLRYVVNSFILILIGAALLYVARQSLWDHLIGQLQGRGPEPETAMKAPEGERAIKTTAYRAVRVEFEDRLPVMGGIEGIREIPLKFQVAGLVTEVSVREGDLVAEGDILQRLNSGDAELKIRYATAKRDTAAAAHQGALKKLEIHQKLYDIGAIVTAKLDEITLEVKLAQTHIDSAEVELESAQAELSKTVLYCPVDSVVIQRSVEPGEYVSPQNVVMRLADLHEVFSVMGVIERDINKIAFGQSVTITVETYPGRTFTGEVDHITPSLEGKTRTLTVKARLKNDDNLLLPGMFARAEIQVYYQPNALIIPSVALEQQDGEHGVFVVDESSESVYWQPVDVGYVTTDYVQIDAGLTEGALVVVDAQSPLKDGTSVEIIEIQEATL